MSTTKERLYDYLRRRAEPNGTVPLSVDQIRVPLALNRHDAIKNLHQLRQRGLLELSLSDNGASHTITGIRLVDKDRHPTEPPMAPGEITSRVRSLLGKLLTDDEGWAGYDRRGLAGLAGVEPQQFSNALTTLLNAGEVEVRRNSHGQIEQFRTVRKAQKALAETVLTAPQTDSDGQNRQSGAPATLRDEDWPLTSAYERAAEAASVGADNPFLTVTFERSPLGDEALRLRQWVRELLKEKAR